MTTAELQGRRLVFDLGDESIAPYAVDPIPATIGRQFTRGYLAQIAGLALPEGFNFEQALIDCFGVDNWKRADEELRQEEGAQIMQAAFFWQTIGGMEAVNLILTEGNEGVKKAIGLFVSRTVRSQPQTPPNMGSEPLTETGDTPGTGSLPGGEKLELRQPRKPQDHKGKAKKASRSRSPRPSSPASSSEDSTI